MSRVDDLHRTYPGVPREVIVKMEILGKGVQDTEDLDKVSSFHRAGRSYITYDFDVTQTQVEEKRTGRSKAGFVSIPDSFRMKNGLGAPLRRHSGSPYEIRDMGSGQFAVCQGEEKVEDIFFVRPFEREEPVTSKGTPATSLVNAPRRCFFIFPVRHCEYFTTGDECKFCNFQSNQDVIRNLGVYRPSTINLEDTIEAYKLLGSQVRFLEGHIEMGGLLNADSQAKIFLGFLERLVSAVPYKPNITIQPEPMARKDLQRLKDVGVDSVTMQMEIWDPRLFADVCPGKAKSRGREGYIQSLQEAVDIFGAGNVGCNTVSGVGLIPANGHTDWQECRDSTVEGFRWMISHGIYPVTTPLRMPPGSVYGADPANQEKYPPSEFYLEMAIGHHQAMQEYGLYQKVNKFVWCAMDCLDNIYGGDIGILGLAGDLGNWLSDVVPAESNWLAKFVSSVNSPANAK
ncbi:MAG: hypothetical protein Q7O66_14600 [Dehalococcoidia bacterium]|nr:hypothetical protein [Dehalococcoidia bacterium]